MTDKKMMKQVWVCIKDLQKVACDYTDGADLKFGVVNPLINTLMRTLAIVQAFDVQETEAQL